MAGKGRSPNYPALGLGESIDLARKLYEAERRASVPLLSAAKAFGYTSLSGRSRVKIATVKKYGLIDETAGRVRVSDVAMRILFPRSDDDRVLAIQTAALKPELFKELAVNAEASDTTLINDLVQRGFMMDGAKAAVASFRETVDFVRPFEAGYDEPDDEDEPMIETPTPPLMPGLGTPATGSSRPRNDQNRSGTDYSWQLPNGVRVELRFAGGPFTKDGLRVLRRYLDVMEEVIPDTEEASVPNPLGPSAPERPS